MHYSFFIPGANRISHQPPSDILFTSLDSTDIAVALGLALASAIVMLPELGAQSLATWNEAIYGVITRQMLARPGLTLHYGGAPWFEKPPLFFWLTAASAKVFGLSEVALRLPAAVCGIAAVVLQYLAGRRLGGRSAGLMAAILLLGVPQFVAYSRVGNDRRPADRVRTAGHCPDHLRS